ncbi:MAG: rubrerythrin [Selenomonas sp.]
MIDKVEKIARMKGAVYDVRRREAKDGESGNKKENFKRMLESAMEKNKKNREEGEKEAEQDAYHLDVHRATQSLFYRNRQMLDLRGLVSRIYAG